MWVKHHIMHISVCSVLYYIYILFYFIFSNFYLQCVVEAIIMLCFCFLLLSFQWAKSGIIVMVQQLPCRLYQHYCLPCLLWKVLVQEHAWTFINIEVLSLCVDSDGYWCTNWSAIQHQRFCFCSTSWRSSNAKRWQHTVIDCICCLYESLFI